MVKVLRNGKRGFDPVEKERLIDACLEPGVLVAGLALKYGVNANQLRNWIKLRQRRQAEKALTVMPYALSAFVRWLRQRRLRGRRPRRLVRHRQGCG
ncbi:transposase [Rhizobium sp. CB3090]|uniref:transposase n=1 Tax=Rhizobium sp. CB3090 TaxID=3039156 RepID=UPI0032C23DE1